MREAAGERPNVLLSETARQRREFDILASVYTLRADLERYGSVQPESWHRVYDEELSFVAEGIDAPLTTRFDLPHRYGRLEAADGTPLGSMLNNGLETARQAAERNPRLRFHAQRAANDLYELEALETMMAGGTEHNTIMSISTFPEEALAAHGPALLISRGYQPQRRLAFLRLYHRSDDHTLKTATISLDNSNLTAFRRMAARRGVHIPATAASDEFGQYLVGLNVTEKDMPELERQLVNEYDDSLQQLTGRKFYQGRLEKDRINPWDFIRQQSDLAGFYFRQVEGLAYRMGEGRTRTELESSKKLLTIQFWKALKGRLDAFRRGQGSWCATARPLGGEDDVDRDYRLQVEMYNAGEQAAQDYDYLIACGGAMSLQAGDMPDSIFDAAADVALSSIMYGGTGGRNEVLRCVHCPLCKRDGVDARIEILQTKKRITCSSCKKHKDYDL